MLQLCFSQNKGGAKRRFWLVEVKEVSGLGTESARNQAMSVPVILEKG